MLDHEWESVDGGPCPKCGAAMGTRWQTDEHDPAGEPPYFYKTYLIEPGDWMGNASYRDDTCFGAYCPECGWKTPGWGWLPGGLWDDCPQCGRPKRMFARCRHCEVGP